MCQDFDIPYSKSLWGNGYFELEKYSLLCTGFVSWDVKTLNLNISELPKTDIEPYNSQLTKYVQNPKMKKKTLGAVVLNYTAAPILSCLNFNVTTKDRPGKSDSQPLCLLLLSCFNGNKLRSLAEVWFDCSAKQRVPLFTSHLANFIFKKIHVGGFKWDSCTLCLVLFLVFGCVIG